MESIIWVIWTAQGADKHLDPANLIEFNIVLLLKSILSHKHICRFFIGKQDVLGLSSGFFMQFLTLIDGLIDLGSFATEIHSQTPFVQVLKN